MSRLKVMTKSRAESVVDDLYKDLERRIIASPPGLCPVDMTASFLKLFHAQTCGKCVPCRIGLGLLEDLLEDVLDGKASLETLDTIERTAKSIYDSADCAIGYEAARTVLKGLEGFRDDFIEHIQTGHCSCHLELPVPCVAKCPASVDIPGYISLVAQGRYQEAVTLIRKDNPFVTACALVCEHPCEEKCRRNFVDDAINIRGLKRYAVDHCGDIEPPICSPSTGKKIAIVGGGPSGLSAAYYLQQMGHQCTIFEQRKELGGMLYYGIPNYRLPKVRLKYDIDHILSTGVEVKCETSIGDDENQISFKMLTGNYDAVYVSIGAHTDKKLGIPGEDAKGVVSAVQMLRDIGEGNAPDFTGKNVIVVGGGNVAMDATRSAIRLGAKNVSVLYRRRKADMTALSDEIEAAIAEGAEILELHAPKRIEKNRKGHVVSMVADPKVIGLIRGGRPSPADSKEAELHIPCDIVIIAIGQDIVWEPFERAGLPVKRGRLLADDDCIMENCKGIFAGGDCVTGPATVIRAIAAGKVAAANIDSYLGFNHKIDCDVAIPDPSIENKPPCGRVNMKERNTTERKQDFDLVEIGMTCQEATQEAHRCLRCDHFGYGIFKGGRQEEW
ncbi:MAG: NAD(P)-binding protein [Eubacteriales bacterium]|nr:NAD(P)-binding protein [Eubacteriales bacterium]